MFLRGVFAVVLFVIGFFLLLGGFGQGGALPKGMFNFAYTVFGRGAYLLPVAFGFWGFYKFKTEEHKVPFLKLLSMSVSLVLFSAWFHAVTATSKTVSAGATEWVDGKGGVVGEVVGGLMLSIFSKYLAGILLFVFVALAFCWTFGIPPRNTFVFQVMLL